MTGTEREIYYFQNTFDQTVVCVPLSVAIGKWYVALNNRNMRKNKRVWKWTENKAHIFANMQHC